MSTRRTCLGCGEELSATAYCRHINDKTGRVCSGRSTFTGECLRAADLDSSFELGSDSDLESTSASLAFEGDASMEFSAAGGNDDNFSGSEVSLDPSLESSTDSSSSDGEVWDQTEDEEEEQEADNTVSTVVSGIFFFLTFYHLMYQLSQRAIASLLGFIRSLLHYLATFTGHRYLFKVATAIPKSMVTIRKSFKQKSFTEFVVCPKCCTLYSLEECIITVNGIKQSKTCTHVLFPNHPHASKRNPCGEVLLKMIKVGSKKKFVPRKNFIYHSVIESLMAMARRKGFLEKCNLWRSRKPQENVMVDIYDGKVWQDLMEINGRPFLSNPNNLCLSLNIDWFRVYEHSPYSAGPIYLVVLNLPRVERFKEENLILVGIIPGPKEPKEHINSFLLPLVQDMKTLYEGVTFENLSVCLGFSTIRATLSCVTCDLPATRKVCGFANFNGKHGCSKCMKNFVTPAFGSKPMYAGFDCDNWRPRSSHVHKSIVERYLQARCKSDQNKIFQDHGVRFSELLNIPHFDIVRFHIIDPMHNIFLGLAKHTICTWKEKKILLVQHFQELQEKVDLITPPPGVGRIPRKIESGFASFTADEWKNWILLYSCSALHNVIPKPHFDCWTFLVDACTLLCHPVLFRSQIDQAHILLIEYCKLFQILYGDESCTPNMHMSLHLKDCMLDFGPLPAFWCFAFERYNGILEGISKSWVAPEKQMFFKFTEVQQLKSLSSSLDTHDELLVFIQCLVNTCKDSGSLGQTKSGDTLLCQNFESFFCNVSELDAEMKSYQCLISPYKEKYFSDAELKFLQEMYQVLYPTESVEVSRFFKQYKKATVHHVEYISQLSRSQRSTAIAAKWPGVVGIDRRGESPVRIGIVVAFVHHTVNVVDSSASKCVREHILARVQWYGDHPRRDSLHSSIVITSTVFDSESSASFIPISRILCQCAVSSPMSFKFDYGFDSVLLAVPLCTNSLC